MIPSKPILVTFPVSPEDMADVDRWFKADRSNLLPKQAEALSSLAVAGKTLALAILRNVPKCADRSAAIRKVREATTTAMEGVVHERGAYERKP